MTHVVYIDLNAKVEQWSLRSAISVSNERYWVYLVPGKVKQLIRQEFTKLHGSKNLQFRVLAFLIYVAVRENLADIQQIVIDQDYSGARAESTIKNYLLNWLRAE